MKILDECASLPLLLSGRLPFQKGVDQSSRSGDRKQEGLQISNGISQRRGGGEDFKK